MKIRGWLFLGSLLLVQLLQAQSNMAFGTRMYAWVDQLRIRHQPSMEAEVIKMLSQGESVELTGKVTSQNETMVLRGQSLTGPWVGVRTTAGVEGWVFSGGLKAFDPYPKVQEMIVANCFNSYDYSKSAVYERLLCWQKALPAGMITATEAGFTVKTDKRMIPFMHSQKDPEDESGVLFGMEGYCPGERALLVFEIGYEYYSTSWVDLANGTVTDLVDSPIFSPDRSRFMVVCNNEMSGQYFLHVYKIQNRELKREYVFDAQVGGSQPYFFENVKWLDPRNITFDLTDGNLPTQPRLAIPKKLIFNGSEWLLMEDLRWD